MGSWLSTTTTLKEQLAVLPLGSVALHVSVLVPTGNEPFISSPEVNCTLTGVHASEAVTTYPSAGPTTFAH